jgi:hypothetical protein
MTRTVILDGGLMQGKVLVIGEHCVAMSFPLRGNRGDEAIIYKPCDPPRTAEGREVWAVQP